MRYRNCLLGQWVTFVGLWSADGGARREWGRTHRRLPRVVAKRESPVVTSSTFSVLHTYLFYGCNTMLSRGEISYISFFSGCYVKYYVMTYVNESMGVTWPMDATHHRKWPWYIDRNDLADTAAPVHIVIHTCTYSLLTALSLYVYFICYKINPNIYIWYIHVVHTVKQRSYM